MKRDQQDKLREIIRRRTGSAAIHEVALHDDLVEQLRLDSLTALEILAAVEKEFGVLFPDESLHEMRTLQRIQDEIDRYSEEFGKAGEVRCASD